MGIELLVPLIVAILPALCSAISAMKSDSTGGAFLQGLMRVINLVALNVGKAKNKEN